MKLKDACSLEEKLWQLWKPGQHIKKQKHHFANKGSYSQGYSFSSRHEQIWELDYKESWVPKNCCFWAVVLEKTLESPLDCKIKLVNPKGNQPWIFIGRTDVEAEAPILWPPDVKNWFIGKNSDAGRDWRRQEKRVTEDGTTDLMDMSFSGSSGSWWWARKPDVLQSMGSQRVGHNWATELN